jgi:oxalate decarboxylase/phosphoglucose isomerase-like protein (cupin superfamily)
MTSTEFGYDPMDTYSVPIKVEKTKLSKIFHMKPRELPEKPGRSLSVFWDSRASFPNDFENEYSYTVTFTEVGNKAGNHYHHKKQELFSPIIGKVKIILEDPETKRKEEIIISADEHKIVFVPPKIAHVVIAESNPAILLVIATSAGTVEDEYPYLILK